MRKLFKVFMILIFLLNMVGCQKSSFDPSKKIASPMNRNLNLYGKWEITGTIKRNNKKMSGEELSRWESKTAQFADKAIQFGDYIWVESDYRARRVNSQSYIISKNEASLQELNMGNKDITVVTVTSKDNFIGEFIYIDNNRIVALIQDYIFYLNKVSEKIDKSLDQFAANGGQGTSFEEENRRAGGSGVLLGFKAPEQGDDGEEESYSYRTLWVAFSGGSLHPVIETRDIIFPRLSGFWKLMVERVREGDKEEDVVRAGEMTGFNQKENAASINTSTANNAKVKIHRNIEYVCNDYIALETNNSETGNDKRLQLQLVDNSSRERGLEISDISGEKGTQALKDAREGFIKGLNLKDTLVLNDKFEEENIGLTRKLGHWLLTGRINYTSNGKPAYGDYTINIVPPPKLVFFDTLYVTWMDIKDRVPEAVDAFTSPNKDIAIVMTKTRLYVYAVTGNKLGADPLFKMNFKEGEKVIMAEWAMGSYVDNWEKNFMRNEVKIIESAK